MRMRVLSTRDKDKSKDNSKDTDKGKDKDKDKDIAPHEHQDYAYEGESIVRGCMTNFMF